MKYNLSTLLSAKAAMILTVALSIAVAACGDPVPVKSMSDARYAISKADSVNAEKYSKDNLEQAQAKLIESHTFASDQKMKDAKTSADEAKRLAELAFDESMPLLTADTKAEVDALIKEAETLNAEEFASEELENAKALSAKGQTSQDEKDYLTAYQSYEQAKDEARKARDLSEAKIEYMKRDAAEVQQMVRQSERYGAKKNMASQYNAASQEVQKAQQQINARQLKTASATLKSARAKAKNLLDNSQKSWASDRYAQAENELSKAEDSMESLNNKMKDPNFKKLYENSETAQAAMKNTQNTLQAATKAKDSSASYLRSGKYTQSYNQSSESIRLSKIVEDQALQVAGIVEGSKQKPEVVTAEVKDASETTTTENATDTTTSEEEKNQESEEGWKTYTVRLIPQRRDCLWRIAGYDFIYNNPRQWSRIYKANKGQIKNPDLIYPGQILNIPPAEGAIGTAPKKTSENEEKNMSSSGAGDGVIGSGR